MHAFAKPLTIIARGAGICGGITLLALMLTTMADVVLRSTFNFAFLGVTEITELGLVIVAILGIAFCGWTEGHIALEFGDKMMPAQAWRALHVVIQLTSAAVTGAVAYYSFAEALVVRGRNAHTNMLQIAEYPFYAIVGLGFLTYTLILLYRAAAGPGRADAAQPKDAAR
jgi:TRAP-type C4-dicarboxylate transport system permease small subunit